ncbi:MAG: GNAT family N-acetyltransferase [Enterocloster bolteae]|uniref:GNAT family N-acetyltransferase n=1 Tax=Enterocloster bolteae TaxID=208479 RepID=UPI0039953BDB
MNMMHTNTAHTNLTRTNMTHTNITHTTTLSRKEQEDIRRISALCRLTDGLSLSCPEDGDEYWLLEEDATAAAFLAVYKTEETMWECHAFTHPDFRRKGYFSALLEQVCQYSEALGEPELCLVTDNKCPAATAALRELGAELWNEEYMMEYNTAADSSEDGKSASHASLPNREPDGADGRKQDMELDLDIRPIPEGLLICARRPGDHPSPDKDGRTSQDRDDITARSKVHSTAQDNTSGTDSTPGACVTCRLSLNSTAAYLYSLETAPALRRRGLASCFLMQLIRCLEREGIRRICLQVSGSNEPALHLYRKTGFRITETLSYYLY